MGHQVLVFRVAVSDSVAGCLAVEALVARL
jgi:hypothetical protein